MDIKKHMALWGEKEPWFYSRWIFTRYTYAFIFGVILALVVIGLVVLPVAYNVAGLLIGYFLAQFIFQFGHMATHALYIENPVDDWEPGVLVAYKHHYESQKAIYKHWLEHRLNFLMQTKGCAVAYVAAWVLPAILFGSAIGPLFVWFLFWFAMVEPVHEYYHVPKKMRKTHFTLPMHYWLRLLEVAGLIDEQHHKEHHNHSRNNLESVNKFSDLYYPGADKLFDFLWKMAVKNKPIRRTIYLQGLALIPLVFSSSSFVFIYFTSA